MSIFDYLFDSDWAQRTDLNRLDERANKLERVLGMNGERPLADQVRELQHEVPRLCMIIESLVEILIARNVCTKEEILQLMQKHKPAPPPQARQCQGCAHEVPDQATACMYCGASLEFETLVDENEVPREEPERCPKCNHEFSWSSNCLYCGEPRRPQ